MKIKRAPAVTWLTTFCLILSLCAGLTLSANTAAQNTNPQSLNRSHANFEADYPALAKYATPESQKALKRTAREDEQELAKLFKINPAKILGLTPPRGA